MTTVTVAAVQAAYVLMDREATLAKVEELLADSAVRAADLPTPRVSWRPERDQRLRQSLLRPQARRA